MRRFWLSLALLMTVAATAGAEPVTYVLATPGVV